VNNVTITFEYIGSGHMLGITLSMVDGATGKVGLEAITVSIRVYVPEGDGAQVARPRLVDLLDILVRPP
jgi:hypothetical protein